MRIIFQSDVKKFKSELHSQMEIREFKKILMEDLILSIDSQELNELKNKVMEDLKKSQWKTMVAELFNLVPRTNIKTMPPVDFYYSDDYSNYRFLDLFIDTDVEKLLLERKKPIRSRENRDSFFQRIFYPFASTASTLIIVDPYLLDSLFDYKNGGIWFINNNVKYGIQNFIILSRNINQYSQTEIKNMMKNHFKKINSEVNLKFQFKLTTPPNQRSGDGAHGRHCRYIYSFNQISPSIELEKGLSIFNKELLDSSNNISSLNLSTALSREKAIEFSKFKSAPFTFEI